MFDPFHVELQVLVFVLVSIYRKLNLHVLCFWREIDSLADPRRALFSTKILQIIGLCLKLRGWRPQPQLGNFGFATTIKRQKQLLFIRNIFFYSQSLIFSNFTGWVTIH